MNNSQIQFSAQILRFAICRWQAQRFWQKAKRSPFIDNLLFVQTVPGKSLVYN